MNESEWTRKMCQSLRAQNAMCFPIVASKMQPAGWPDRILVHAHLCPEVVLLEFKGVSTPITALQATIVGELRRRANTSCYIVRICEMRAPCYGAWLCDEHGECLRSFVFSSWETAGRVLIDTLRAEQDHSRSLCAL